MNEFNPRIGAGAYPEMAQQARNGNTMVVFTCEHCQKSCHTFGNLTRVQFLSNRDDSPGLWRTSVRCIECKKVTNGVHFQELRHPNRYGLGPEIWDWRE